MAKERIMSDGSQRRRVPTWAVVLAFLVVAAIAGVGGWLIGHPGPVLPAPTPTSTVTTTTTVTTTVTPPVTPAVVPTTAPKPAPKPKTVLQWAFVTGGFTSGGKLFIKVDNIGFYSGTGATAAQTKYGGSLRPDGTYVRNTSSTIRTLALKSNAQIQLVEWLETGTPGSSWKYGVADPNAFVAVLAGTATSPSGVWSPADKAVLLTITGTTVTAVKQYSPGG
jgi:hypothetical protein